VGSSARGRRHRLGCPSPGPAAGRWPTTSWPRGRPAATPRRAAAGAAPGSVPAGCPARPLRSDVLQRGPGGREGRPGHGIGRPARVGAAGPGDEPEVAVAVLAGQGGQHAGRQRGPTDVVGLDLQDLLVVRNQPSWPSSHHQQPSSEQRPGPRGGPTSRYLPRHCPISLTSSDLTMRTSQAQGPGDGEMAAAANAPGPAGPTALLPQARRS
jgi:hypothetical protein